MSTLIPWLHKQENGIKIDLSGKTAIVTGSTKGIGKGIAQGLTAAGVTVVVTGRIQPQVDALVKELATAHADMRLTSVRRKAAKPC